MKYLIAGLGNIGIEYVNTRHNAGFMVLDALAATFDAQFTPERYALVAQVRHKGRLLTLIKPSTYMNLSGKAVRYYLEKEKINFENLLAVLDDIDLPLGTLRIRPGGSGGSHNGLNHIIDMLGTSEFPRLRIGIGNDFPRGSQVEYVLGKWTPEELEKLSPVIEQAVKAIQSFVTTGIAQTMNQFNKK